MNQVTTSGLDIAKSIFQVHGVDVAWRSVLRQRLSRSRVPVTLAASASSRPFPAYPLLAIVDKNHSVAELEIRLGFHRPSPKEAAINIACKQGSRTVSKRVTEMHTA